MSDPYCIEVMQYPFMVFASWSMIQYTSEKWRLEPENDGFQVRNLLASRGLAIFMWTSHWFLGVYTLCYVFFVGIFMGI